MFYSRERPARLKQTLNLANITQKKDQMHRNLGGLLPLLNNFLGVTLQAKGTR